MWIKTHPRKWFTLREAYEIFVSKAKEAAPGVYERQLKGRVLQLIRGRLVNGVQEIHIPEIHIDEFQDYLEREVLRCEFCGVYPTDKHPVMCLAWLDAVACVECRQGPMDLYNPAWTKVEWQLAALRREIQARVRTATGIKEAREALQLTQEQFAAKLKLGKGGGRIVGGWERGEHSPAGYVAVAVSYMLTETDAL